MKKLKVFLLAIGVVITSLTFNSCLDDDGYSLGDVWFSIATVESKNESYAHYFRLDGGETLWPSGGNYNGHNLDDGQRTLLYYTILSDSLQGFSHFIQVRDIDPILTKMTAENKGEENEEYYGDDPLGIRNMWVGGGYLNIVFVADYGWQKKHFVNLVKDLDEENPYYLEFRHNAYDDPAHTRLTGMVCFNLSEIDTNGQTVTLTIRVNTFEGEKEYTFEYNSGDKSESKETIPSDLSSGFINNIS